MLRELAFGPLPKAQVQASRRIGHAAPSLSGPPRSSGPSLSDLGDATPSGGTQGFERIGESFNPVFPDLFAANQGGDVMDLPGAGGGTDFNSDIAQGLAGLKPTGVTREPFDVPDAWRTDLDAAFKALKGATGGVKAVEGRPRGASGLGGAAGSALSGLDSSGFSLTGPDTGGFDWSGFSLNGTSPDIAGLEGFSASDLGSASGAAGGLGGAGSYLGALNALYGLAQAAGTGNPLGLAQGALGAYGALSNVAGVTPLASTLASLAPETAAAVASALTGTTVSATAGAPAISAALSAAAAAYALPVAAVLMLVMSAVNNQEEQNMRESGWWNNPIKGALYSNATAGVGQTNKILAGLGDLKTADTNDLLQALVGGTSAVLPYYATAQGGVGAIRASDTVTGAGGKASNAPYTGDGASPAQYTANFTQARTGLEGLVNELMRRGATYQELGQLPVTGNWAMESLDAGGRPEEYLAKSPRAGAFGAEGNALFGSLGFNPLATSTPASGEGGGWTTESIKGTPDQLGELLKTALGSSMLASDKDTKASGLMTDMYGGPLWAALARMGVGGNLGDLILQNFDPWVNARTWAPASRRPQPAQGPPEAFPGQWTNTA
jgi:hypothetical protein